MALIKKRKLSDDVLDEIKNMIQRGELKEGDKLPNQNEFAAQLGVSRQSLREALAILTQHGAVVQKQGSGTVIKSVYPALYADQLALPSIGDEISAEELIEARRIIEMSAVGMAAQRVTDDQIKEMETLLNKMSKAVKEENYSLYAQKDVAFHFVIAKATQNRVLPYLLVSVRGFIEQSLEIGFSSKLDILKDSIKEHRNIFLAIKNKDKKRALAEMKKHLDYVEDVWQRGYKITTNKRS